MKKINQLMTTLAEIFRPTNKNTKVTHLSSNSSTGSESDWINYCYSMQHDGSRIRRALKTRGKSADGNGFEVLECPVCGKFAAVRRDSASQIMTILFTGRYYRADYNARRQNQHSTPLRPIRAAHRAIHQVA